MISPNMRRNAPTGWSNVTPRSTGSNSESTPPAARDLRSTAHQVVATRSLSELAAAINAVRGNFAPSAHHRSARAEFVAALEAHTVELQRSPGRNWLDLEKSDFAQAVKLRLAIEKFDASQRCGAAAVPGGKRGTDRAEFSNICRNLRGAA